MLELAVPGKDALSDKLERTARLSGLSGGSLMEKHQDLFRAAADAYPHLPARRRDRLIGFYFTAALAATEMTPTLIGRGWSRIEVDAPFEGGELFLYTTIRQLPNELRPPRAPLAFIPRFARTEFSSELISRWAAVERADLERADLAGWPLQAGYHRPHDVGAPLAPGVEPFKAFTQLKEWLRLTSAQLTSLLGIKRTTPNAWDREGRKPRPETEVRLFRLHAYVSDLARRPDAAEQLARVRPVLPVLTKAIYSEAALPSDTLELAGVDIPFDWRKLNAFQAKNKIPITADEEGAPLGEAPTLEGIVVEEDEDDLGLLY